MGVDRFRPEINMSKIPVSGDLAGLLFALGSTLIFLLGIPSLRVFFAAAVVSGCGIAIVLRFIRP